MCSLLVSTSIFLICILWQVSAAVVNIQLNDGYKIPAFSFGTYALKTPTQSVIKAIEAGYRHFDTAALYKNEEDIGRGLRDTIQRGILTREELFITGKLNSNFHRKDQVIPALQKTLKNLDLDYLDLYLIHLPMATTNEGEFLYLDYIETWRGMEKAQRLGLTRSIGLSNFNSRQINRILTYCDVPPAVNEIEVNPTFPNLALVSYCKENNIQVMAFSPFGFMVPRRYDLEKFSPPFFDDPYFKQLAKKYGKNTSQIAMRYLIDRNLIPIPRSDNATHITENINVFDFQLAASEVLKINTYDINTRVYDLGQYSYHIYYSFNQS